MDRAFPKTLPHSVSCIGRYKYSGQRVAHHMLQQTACKVSGMHLDNQVTQTKHDSRTILSKILHRRWLLMFHSLPPPFLKHKYGNRQTLPRPIIIPATTNRNSTLLLHWPRSLISSSVAVLCSASPIFEFVFMWTVSVSYILLDNICIVQIII